MNNLRNNSLFWLVLGGGAALVIWWATAATALQVLLGLLLVLVLPGYALTKALFTHQQLGWAERILLVGGASIALAMLGSLLLQQSGWRLDATDWVALFVAVTLLAALGAWLVRRPQTQTTPAPMQVGLKGMHLVLLGLAVLVTSVAFTTARSATPAQGFQGYTLLWLTPQEGNAPNRIQLGVTSKEFMATAYKVQIKVNDQLAQEWPQLTLAPNQVWQASLEVPRTQTAQSTVEAVLYRLDQPETPYRHVILRPNR